MAQPRLAMRKIKDILRLHLLGGVTSCRQIGRAAGCGKSAVAECEELARRDHHVTLALLWSEYKAEHPDGYQYSPIVI